MPKNKTHSGTKKRFKVTGSGKLHAVSSANKPPPAGGQDLDPHPPPGGMDAGGLARRRSKKVKRLLGLLDSRPAEAINRASHPICASMQIGALNQGVLHVARVKRAVNAQKKRRESFSSAPAVTAGSVRASTARQKSRCTHSLVVLVPGPPGA